jgi:hypothetical protein
MPASGSTAELGAHSASKESGGSKHQSSSHPAGGRAAGIGQWGHDSRQCGGYRRRSPASIDPRTDGHGSASTDSVVRVGLAEEGGGCGQDAEADYEAEDQQRHLRAQTQKDDSEAEHRQ